MHDSFASELGSAARDYLGGNPDLWAGFAQRFSWETAAHIMSLLTTEMPELDERQIRGIVSEQVLSELLSPSTVRLVAGCNRDDDLIVFLAGSIEASTESISLGVRNLDHGRWADIMDIVGTEDGIYFVDRQHVDNDESDNRPFMSIIQQVQPT